MVLAVIALFAINNSFQNEVTVYNMFCTEGLKEGKCTSKEGTANPTTYKVIFEQQTIIYWSGNNTAPNRLQNCAIRNTKNWSCQLSHSWESEPKIEWQMVNGQFQKKVAPQSYFLPRVFYQTSVVHWWWIWLMEHIK